MDPAIDNVALINENANPEEPGDVTVFRTTEAACRYLEPWWVEAGSGLALTVQGQRIEMGVRDGRVIEVTRHAYPDGPVLVRRWREAYAMHVFAARSARSGKNGPFTPAPPESIEDLIAYVGFTD